MPAVLIREAVPADAGAVARVHVDSWRTTYRGIIADSILSDLSYELRERHWHSALTEHRDRNFIHVAESDDGRAERLLQEGMRSMLLWVLVENPNRGFYERLGGKRLEEKQITIDGERLTEVAYGWADLHDLLPLRPSLG